MASAPLNKIETAHQMYRDGEYEEALGFYTEALSMAKTKPQKIALHSNRVACYLKLHDFKKVILFPTASESVVFYFSYLRNGMTLLMAVTLLSMRYLEGETAQLRTK